MSFWTLKLLEIMISLFYLRHIMLKTYLVKNYPHVSTPYD